MSLELAEEARSHLALVVMEIFENWQVSPEQAIQLLGMPDAKPRELTRYRRGQALPDDETVLEHAKHIVGINRALFVTFPLNPKMPTFWLRNKNRQLKRPPLQIMLEEGLPGMDRVWRNLDCTRNWDDTHLDP